MNQLLHYVPMLTRTKKIGGFTLEETVCGLFVGFTAISPAEHEPTCPVCRDWLGLEPHVETITVQRVVRAELVVDPETGEPFGCKIHEVMSREEFVRRYPELQTQAREADTHGRTEDVVSGEGQEPAVPGDCHEGWGHGV